MMPVPAADHSITRVPRSKSSAREFYDRISGFYDLLTTLGERRIIAAGLQKLAVQRSECILEIGFGTGNALVVLTDAAGAAGKVCGIDISSGMCRVARRKIQEAGLFNITMLSLGDAVSLPYRNAAFDAIFISFTLELFDTLHIPLVLADCHRVLRPEGRICVVALSKDAELGSAGRLYEKLHVRFPQVLDCRPIPLGSILRHEGFQVLDSELHALWWLPVGIVLAQKNAW